MGGPRCPWKSILNDSLGVAGAVAHGERVKDFLNVWLREKTPLRQVFQLTEQREKDPSSRL